MFEKMMTLWFVIVTCPLVFALSLYDVFIKGNMISILLTFLILALFFSSIHTIRTEWRKKKVEKADV